MKFDIKKIEYEQIRKNKLPYPAGIVWKVWWLNSPVSRREAYLLGLLCDCHQQQAAIIYGLPQYLRHKPHKGNRHKALARYKKLVRHVAHECYEFWKAYGFRKERDPNNPKRVVWRRPVSVELL